MGFLETLSWLNSFEIPSEKGNAIAIALCMLVPIFVIHEILESVIAFADTELTSHSMAGFLILRSHYSFFRMLSLCRLEPIDPKGVYHRLDCRCAEDVDTLQDEDACRYSRNGSPVQSRLLVRTSVLRVFLIVFEVAFLCLAMTRSHEKILPNGRYAFTVRGNDFGTPVDEFINDSGGPGCFELFNDKKISTGGQNINRITQLVKCVSKKRPVAVLEKDEIQAQFGPPPPGFSIFLLDFDHSGDKAVITHLDKVKYGAEMYAYWKSRRPIEDLFQQ